MKDNKIILLFPGGFKPFHDGHLSVLESHIFNTDNIRIDEVRIYVSSKDRDNITADTSLWFLNNIKNKLSYIYDTDIIPEISDIPSPIAKCYKDVSTCITDDKFCLVSSDKGNDIERKHSFIKAYMESGKLYDSSKGVQTVFVNADIKPVSYKHRKDSLNDTYVSSTIIRNDIRNKSFDMFCTGYENMVNNGIVSKELLIKYYEKLDKLLNVLFSWTFY